MSGFDHFSDQALLTAEIAEKYPQRTQRDAHRESREMRQRESREMQQLSVKKAG
jgi:hypothetical protein